MYKYITVEDGTTYETRTAHKRGIQYMTYNDKLWIRHSSQEWYKPLGRITAESDNPPKDGKIK